MATGGLIEPPPSPQDDLWLATAIDQKKIILCSSYSGRMYLRHDEYEAPATARLPAVTNQADVHQALAATRSQPQQRR
jgi:hypothetical protein